MTKKAIFVVIWTHKKLKLEKKKSLFEVLEGPLRIISTRNWVNWIFFEKNHSLSGEKIVPKCLPRRQKKGVFFPKIGQFSVKI